MSYDVRQISGTVATEYIRANHYTGTCHGRPFPCFGLYDEDTLMGVLMFAQPVSEMVRKYIFGPEHKHTVTELHRLHTHDDTPTNTESWFIMQCIKRLTKIKPEIRAVVSFADTTEGHAGTIYQATNFLYYGKTSARTFYRDQEGRLRAPRQEGKNITIAEAEARGWDKVRRLPKNRYVLLVGDRRQRRIYKKLLRVPVQPYPPKEE